MLAAMIFRMRALALICAALAATASQAARAQDHPARPIRLLVGFTAGGTTDLVARIVAEPLRRELKQNVIVENRPGASGAIAAEYAAKSEPDGTTLLFATVGAAAINPALRSNLAYDPIKDFAPVGLAVRNTTMLVVRATMPVDSARGLAALARERPGAVTMGITGSGSISHLALELYAAAAGVQFQAVPYRGASQAITDVLAGQLDGLFADVPTFISQAQAGKLRPLAAASQERSGIFPAVATLLEQGYVDTFANQWAGILSPAHTPAPAIEKISGGLDAALSDPQVRGKLEQVGVIASPSSPAEFAALLQAEIARWSRVIREKGIRGD